MNTGWIVVLIFELRSVRRFFTGLAGAWSLNGIITQMVGVAVLVGGMCCWFAQLVPILWSLIWCRNFRRALRLYAFITSLLLCVGKIHYLLLHTFYRSCGCGGNYGVRCHWKAIHSAQLFDSCRACSFYLNHTDVLKRSQTCTTVKITIKGKWERL